MPDQSIEPREHYVYALYREDGVTPFYIGMGVRDRWMHHELRWRYEGRSHKANIVKNMVQRGIVVPKAKLAEGLTLSEAQTLEIKLIAEIGREPHGPLTNLTIGGEGVFGLPPEKVAERANSLRRTYAERPELREAVSRLHKTRKRTPLSPEHKARLREANLGKRSNMSEETRARLRASTQKGTERQAQMKAGRRAKEADPEFVARRHDRISAAQKKWWAEHREEMMAKRKTTRAINHPPKPPKEPYSYERRCAVQAALWATRKQEILQKRVETIKRKTQKTEPHHDIDES